MNYIYFFVLYYFLFFLGRALLITINKNGQGFNENSKIVNSKIYIFYPSLALFFLGNLAIVLNFFFSLNSIKTILIFICLLFLMVNFKEKLVFSYKDFFITNLVIPGILNISTYKMWLHYDAGLYHLNNQLWINESKVVFGLGNVNMWFSWSSLFEYISSYFWLGENFIGLHYLNIIFFALFYSFLYFQIVQSSNKFLKYSSLNIVAFGLLDNFGINGGGNGFLFFQTVGKPDTAFTVIFFITLMLLINSILENKYSNKYFTFFLYLSFFSIQLKAFGFYLIPLLIFYFYNLDQKLKIIKNLKLLISLSIIWCLKNIIISGCLFFPFEFTCFNNLSWYSRGRATVAREALANQHIAYLFNKPLDIWFTDWILHGKNYQIYTNFFISFIILLFLNFIFFKNDKKFINKKIVGIRVYQLILLFSWIGSAPNSRFGMIICLMLVGLIRINFLERDFQLKILLNKNFILIILFISVLLTPRFYSYQELSNNPFKLTEIKSPEQQYIDSKNNWAVYPINNDNRCWVNINCMDHEKNIFPETLGSYKLFRSEIFKSN